MLLVSIYINYEKVFQLVFTGDNNKKNTKYLIFLIKMLMSAKIAETI